MNIAHNPEGQARLNAHGFTGVPIVCNGEVCVPGADLQAIADLVGFEYTAPAMMTPQQLYERWDVILQKAIGFVRQLRDDQLPTTPPDRPRTLLDLCYHVFTIGRIYKRAYDEDSRESWQGMMDPAPEGQRTTAGLIEYGEGTRTILKEWWETAGQYDPLDRVLEAYWGAKTLHEVMERETWHTTQHTRQVEMFLGILDVTPEVPLVPEDLAGLPLPERVWD